MKLPDLHELGKAGVVEYHGTADAVTQAAHDAHMDYMTVDLSHVDSKATLLDALANGLKFPEHFGHNWDALADCLEDDGFLRKPGAVVRIAHTAHYRRTHAADWTTLEEILGEAAEYWKERHIAFWTVLA